MGLAVGWDRSSNVVLGGRAIVMECGMQFTFDVLLTGMGKGIPAREYTPPYLAGNALGS